MHILQRLAWLLKISTQDSDISPSVKSSGIAYHELEHMKISDVFGEIIYFGVYKSGMLLVPSKENLANYGLIYKDV